MLGFDEILLALSLGTLGLLLSKIGLGSSSTRVSQGKLMSAPWRAALETLSDQG